MTVPDQCWRRIGVYGGNHQCERLATEIHCRNCAVFSAAARTLLKRETEPLPALASALDTGKDSDSRSLLAFRLGREWLGLRCDRIVEVAESRPPRRLAHRGGGRLEGLVAVRGELHLCVALIEALHLGMRSELDGERTRLILLDPPQAAPIAFRCSEVIGLCRIRVADIEEVPATLPPALARCLSGVAKFEHGRMAVLDEPALLSTLDEALYS